MCGGTSWNVVDSSDKAASKSVEVSLSNTYVVGATPARWKIACICLQASVMEVAFLFFMGIPYMQLAS